MLKDGEKGVIRQKGKPETYAVAPHVPCGVISPEMLRKIADVSEKYMASALKITSAARIAIIGVDENEVDDIWQDLGMAPGNAVGLCVRSIKVCPGTTYCRLGLQDSLEMGMKLDSIYHGMKLPSKMKMGVSGCRVQCAENCIKDISLYGTKEGWTLMAGGRGSAKPRLADTLAEGLSSGQAEQAVANLVTYYRENSKRERIGFMIERVGLDTLKAAAMEGL